MRRVRGGWASVRWLVVGGLICGGLSGACSSSGPGPSKDGGGRDQNEAPSPPDTGQSDAGGDASDAGDGPADAAPDSPADAAPDAPGDTAPDAPGDGAPTDAGSVSVTICPGSWPDASPDGGAPDAADAGGGDASDAKPSVCGNSVIEPGETCDPPQAPWGGSPVVGTGCTADCHLIDACSYGLSDGATTGCYKLAGADRANCFALEGCLQSYCEDLAGGHLMRCYCDVADDATCRSGKGIGICRPQFEVAAGTTDPAQIIAAFTNPQSPVGAAASMASRAIGMVGYPTYCSVGGAGGYGRYPSCGDGFLSSQAPPYGLGEQCDPPNGATCSLADCRTMTPDPDLAGTTCANPTSTFAWTVEPTPPGLAQEMWTVAPNDTWLRTTRDFRHWNGSRWSVTAPPWLSASTYTWAAAPNETTSDYRQFPLQFPSWSPGPGDLWFTNGILRRWRGTSGSVWTDMIDMPITRVWGLAADDVWAFLQVPNATSYPQASRAFHWNGAGWAEFTLPPVPKGGTLSVGAIWGASTNDVWAFAEYRFNSVPGLAILHWNGTAWLATNDPCDPTYAYYQARAAWGSGPRDIWLLAGKSTLSLWHYDGSSWALSTSLPWSDFVDSLPTAAAFIWGSSARDVWAAARSSGQVAHYDGSSWTMMPTGATSILWFGGEGPETVWAIGNVGSPRLLRWHHGCADSTDGGVD